MINTLNHKLNNIKYNVNNFINDTDVHKASNL